MFKLRVAIPTLNAGKTLSSTLDSLRSLDDFAEIVVVDSGSTDETLSIAQQYRVEVRYCPAGNMYAAINEGLSDAQAEWLTYINADDILFASNIVERIQSAGSDEDVLYGAVDFIDCEGRYVHSWKSARPHHLLALYQAGFSPMLQQGTLFRSHVFAENQGFSTRYKYVSDADFWFRSLQAGFTFSRVESPTVAGFRLHDHQFSQRMADTMRQEHKEMWKYRTAQNTSSIFSVFWALSVWRYDNMCNYIERVIRRKALEGRVRIPKSYDMPVR